MPSNIEIKAKLVDPQLQRSLARELCAKDPELLYQEDIFFNVPEGRLKLRVFSETKGVLVFYKRPDTKGPKASEYFLADTATPRDLEKVLSLAYGATAKVIKQRTLYMYGRTRIHLDKVQGLGDFLELEVVMQAGEPLNQGQKEAQDLMQKLSINNSDLIDCAYVDLLQGQH